MPPIPGHVGELIPRGCTVVDYPNISTIHSPTGDLVAIACGVGASHRARLISTMPVMLASAESALNNGMLGPLARGLDVVNDAVFPPRSKLPA